MPEVPGATLIELLHAQNPDMDRIIRVFISRFNAAYGDPGAEYWSLTPADWQRYEFLGDRVLNLIIAQTLFSQRPDPLDEGAMTKILGSVVSNKALGAFLRGHPAGALLIPMAIREQNTYGARVMGGAFEAFIGALYCEVGLDDVTYFVNGILAGLIRTCNPQENAIGLLQEFFQKRGMALPVYADAGRTGPDHKPLFTVTVTTPDGHSFSGTGPSRSEARMAAARAAFAVYGQVNDPFVG